ncbi:MAG: dephospho-CoA kinase, partial [Verrucomicrobia bacterium]|nr:dephospho-CoA kinase [Verrucomicrobiota bacterium]
APMSVQVERLKLRGLTPAEARARIAAQWPVEEKMRRADYVVFNGGTPDCARRQTVRIFDDIVQHMEKKHGRNPSTR